MNRKKKILLSLLAVGLLGLVSCNKKDPENKPDEKKGDAYVSFTFNLPQGDGFRAGGGVADKNAKDTYAGTHEEQAIKEVRVVLYDPDNGKLKYAFDYSITASNGQAPTGDGISNQTTATTSKFTTVAKQVVKQKYWMLAFINPTEDVKKATAEGKYFTDARAAITTTPDALKSNGILMSNERWAVTIEIDKLKDTKDNAEKSPVAVSVDRILAKVFVGGIPTFEHGKLTKKKWQLNTTNKKTYLFRHFGQVVKSCDEFEVELATDNSQRWDRYAEDPNFYEQQFDASHNDFTYLTDATPELKNEFGFEDAHGEYCLENTMDKEQQKHNRTTSFVLSGTWTPSEHHSITFTEGQTWYSYMGFTFTTEKMKEYKAECTNNAMNDKIEISGTPAGFKTELKELLQNGTDHKIKDDGDIDKSFVYKNIKGYKNGKCYYQTNLIRHWTDQQSSKDMGYGRYGVVRNNIYKISIKKISQPGEPTVINEKDDDDPDDPTKVYIAFDITVNPWIVRTQDISL